MRVAATGGAVKEIAARMVKLASSAQMSQPDVRCRVFVNMFLVPPEKKRALDHVACGFYSGYRSGTIRKQGLTNVDFGMTGVNMQFL